MKQRKHILWLDLKQECCCHYIFNQLSKFQFLFVSNLIMSINKIYLRHFKHFSLNSIFWEDFQDSEETEMSTDYKIGNLISNNLRASEFHAVYLYLLMLVSCFKIEPNFVTKLFACSESLIKSEYYLCIWISLMEDALYLDDWFLYCHTSINPTLSALFRLNHIFWWWSSVWNYNMQVESEKHVIMK